VAALTGGVQLGDAEYAASVALVLRGLSAVYGPAVAGS